MTKEEMDKWAENWRKKRDSMPIKTFYLTFNLVDGKMVKVKVEAKDELDIRSRLDGTSRFDFNKNEFNESVSIYKDHVIYINFEGEILND